MSPSYVSGRAAKGGKLWSGQNPPVVPPEGWGQGVVQGPRPAAGDAEGGPAPGSGGVRAHSPGALQAALLSGPGVCLLIHFDPPGVLPGRKVTTPFQRGEK